MGGRQRRKKTAIQSRQLRNERIENRHHVIVNGLDTGFHQEADRSQHPMNADPVFRGHFITPGIVQEVDPKIKEIPRVLDGQPADVSHRQLLEQGGPDIEKTNARRRHEPFVSPAGKEVDAAGLYIERHRAESLNGIHGKQNIMTPADFAKRLQVIAVTVDEFDKTDGHQAGPWRDQTREVVRRRPTIGRLDEINLNAESFQVEKGVHVGGEFAIGQNDPVTAFPWQTGRNMVEAFGCVFDEGDAVGGCMNELSDEAAQALTRLQPAFEIDTPFFQALRRVAGDCLVNPGRIGGHGRVIDIDHVACDREILPQGPDGIRRVHGFVFVRDRRSKKPTHIRAISQERRTGGGKPVDPDFPIRIGGDANRMFGKRSEIFDFLFFLFFVYISTGSNVFNRGYEGS